MEDTISLFASFFEKLDITIPADIAPLNSVGALFTTITALLASTNFNNDVKFGQGTNTLGQDGAYDFIVVGSGSAGGIIANRLSESGEFKVLLLEAGGDPSTLNEIPFFMSYNLGYPETDWAYKIKPQTNSCLALVDNGMTWNRGKSLGGTSNLNFMVYMRGNPNDFNGWAEITQDPGWSYDNLLPFFKKTEHYEGNFPNDETYHGKEGPIWVTSSRVLVPLSKEWVNAAEELGYSSVDPNARQMSSFSPVEWNIRNGKRSEVYEGFIKPALERSNLDIKRYAHVTKIIVDSDKKATGVEYMRHGLQHTAKATKEVVLSAGAIGSPQLLMLSGIGPKYHLESFGIEPIVHLPGVGQNLMDHAVVNVGPFLLNESVSFFSDRDLTPTDLAEYIKSKSGVLTSPIVSGVGMISTTNNTDWPDIGLFLFPTGIEKGTSQFIEHFNNVKRGLIEQYFEGYTGRDSATVVVVQELPSSRGSITLQSRNPFDPPIIDPNYFSDPTDLQPMVAAFRFVVRMLEETKTWQKFNATLIPNHFPGCEEHPLKTDAYYECFIRHFTSTGYHYGSTCKMGRVDDEMAVVDSELRVKGVSNLRVADASIMPRITNANLNAPTMMIGEKAADLILKSWRDPSFPETNDRKKTRTSHSTVEL